MDSEVVHEDDYVPLAVLLIDLLNEGLELVCIDSP
jgi:hypothetical protein